MIADRMRIREPMEPSGFLPSRHAAVKKYAKHGLTYGTLQGWIAKGEVLEDERGIDEKSLRVRLSIHKPRSNNSIRQPQAVPKTKANQPANGHRKTTAEIHAGAEALGNGHAKAPEGHAQPSAGSGLIIPPSPLVVPGNGATPYGREWLDKFYADKARRAGGVIHPKTMENYKECLERFVKAFPILPITGNRIQDRQTILNYIHTLKNLTDGGELSGGSKDHHHQVITTFIRWMGREHGIIIPDLADAGIVVIPTQNVPIWPDEIRLVLNEGAKQRKRGNHTEYLIPLLLAQTGCRVGELCTFRKEFLHDHWIEVWGKRTTANPTGYRELPIPDEAYKLLEQHLDQFKVLTWIGSDHHKPKALVGPIEPAIKGVPIDMRRHETYRVTKATKRTTDKVKYLINRLMDATGVNQKGKGTHSFRRGYQAQVVRNGMSREFYRLAMGHRQKSDMDDLYTYAPIETIVEQANKYAPRSFLLEEATQAQLALEAQKLAALDPTLPHDEDDDDE